MTSLVPPQPVGDGGLGLGLSSPLGRSLAGLLEACVRVLDGSGATLDVIDRQGVPRPLVCGGDGAEMLDRAQAATLEGPGIEAFVHNRAASTSDLVADERWPALAATLAQIPVHAACAFPVRLGRCTVGDLTVFRCSSEPWRIEDLQALGRYGAVTESLLASGARTAAAADAGLVGRMHRAAADRTGIERGIGYLMADRGLSPDRAFAALATAARREGSDIRDTVAHLLATDGAGERSGAGRVTGRG